MSRRWIIWGWKQVVEYACRSGGKSDEAVAVDGGSRSGRSRSSSTSRGRRCQSCPRPVVVVVVVVVVVAVLAVASGVSRSVVVVG